MVEQDLPLTSKNLEITLLSDAFVEPSRGGTVYTSQSVFFIDVICFMFPEMVKCCIKFCLSVVLRVKIVLTGIVIVKRTVDKFTVLKIKFQRTRADQELQE